MKERKLFPLTGDIIEQAEDRELEELKRRAIERGIATAEELDDMD